MTSSSNDQIVWKRSRGNMKEMMEEEEEESHRHHHCCSNKKKKKKMMMKSSTSTYELVSYRDLPDYMKDNEFITGYYRSNWPVKAALYSLFRWHNETLNVWTHLIGFLVFLGFTVVNLMQFPQVAHLFNKFTRSFSLAPAAFNASHTYNDFFLGGVAAAFINVRQTTTHTEMLSTATWILAASRWPFFVFLVGAMFCLFTSSTCHLFCCHSPHMNLLLLRFDYVGIAVMIVTSFFPPIYYVFQCNPLWQFVYLAGISTLGIFTVVTLLSPALSTKEYRRFRALLFFSMGFSGIVPTIHACIINWNEPRRFITLAYESAMALSYAIGTLFYVTRIPERWKPGRFDLAGHSHNIFHVFVILGALAHYGAALVFIDWRDTVGCDIVL